MYDNLALIPIQLWTVAVFRAPDPWNGNASAEWVLSVYRMTAARNRELYATYSVERQGETATGQNLDREDVLGIRSSADGLYHVLPIGMVRLWQKGQLPNGALPRLIAAMEPQLTRDDFYAPQLGRRWPTVLAVCIGLLGCLFLLPGLYVLITALPGVSGGALILLGFAALYLGIAAFSIGRRRRQQSRIAGQERDFLALL